MTAASINAIAPWFGAKRTMAPVIVKALGPHKRYWSLFTGSFAVELAKSPCETEVCNDLHGDLINLANVIRDPVLGAKLYRWLRRTVFGEPLFAQSRQAVEQPFEEGLDPGDNRLAVPRGQDRLVSGDEYAWCGECGAIDNDEVRHTLQHCRKRRGKGGCLLREDYSADEF